MSTLEPNLPHAPEILAPVGSDEALDAALASGAVPGLEPRTARALPGADARIPIQGLLAALDAAESSMPVASVG